MYLLLECRLSIYLSICLAIYQAVSQLLVNNIRSGLICYISHQHNEENLEYEKLRFSNFNIIGVRKIGSEETNEIVRCKTCGIIQTQSRLFLL